MRPFEIQYKRKANSRKPYIIANNYKKLSAKQNGTVNLQAKGGKIFIQFKYLF
jgi:hypothetical protein